LKNKFRLIKIPIGLVVMTIMLFGVLFISVKQLRVTQIIEITSAKLYIKKPNEANNEQLKEAAIDMIYYTIDLQNSIGHLLNDHKCSPKEISTERYIDYIDNINSVATSKVYGINPYAPNNGKCGIFNQDQGSRRKFKTHFGDIEITEPIIISSEFQILDKHAPEALMNQEENADLAIYIPVNRKICDYINESVGIKSLGYALENDRPKVEFNGSFVSSTRTQNAAPDNGESQPGALKAFKDNASYKGCWKIKDYDIYIFYTTLLSRKK
jgi:hypothetical protein